MRPNYLPIALKPLIAIAVLLFAANAYAANWYVRPNSAGSSTGVDWNNAWSASSIQWSSVRPGDTVWMAGGSYAGPITISANGTASSRILINRVRSTDAAPVAAAGWNSSFDSTVAIAVPTGGYGCIVLQGTYFTVDGRVPFVLSPGTVGLTSNAGMVLTVSIAGGDAVEGGFNNTTLNSITLQNISIAGPYANNTNKPAAQSCCGINLVPQSTAVNNVLINACSVVGMGEALRGNGWVNTVIQYCYIADTANDGTQHEDVIYDTGPDTNCIWRYNIINNSPNDGVFFAGGDSGAPSWQSWYFYGNIMYNSQNGLFGNKPGAPAGPIYVFNNVFQGSGSPIVGYDALISPTNSKPSYTYNNIFYNVSNQPTYQSATGAVIIDSNYNAYTSGKPAADGANSITFTGNPFVNIPSSTQPVGSIGDFHLTAAMQAQFQKGYPITNILPADGFINVDRDGNVRGSGGNWYIGAYQYAGVTPAAPQNFHLVTAP
jgi:hypothetical protein